MMLYNANEWRAVTLTEVLDAREKRAELQKKLLSDYEATLISFTMNIAGPIKNSPAINRAYRYGLTELLKLFPADKILYKHTQSDHCGPFALLALDINSEHAKELCVSLEEKNSIGRLFDIDVIDRTGKKLERRTQRSCIVCGKPGRECAAGRLHPVEELVDITNKIISDHFCSSDAELLGKSAAESLIREVETTPKPGLVDLSNNGSHTDMDVETFRKSALALEPYFIECVQIGMHTKKLTAHETFDHLRASGLLAEEKMYEATSGINTHKGLIYSMGVLLGAIGRLWSIETPVSDTSEIVAEVTELVRESTMLDFQRACGTTAGERLYKEKGLAGIRGEVASGFSSVINISLPAYISALYRGLSQNDAGIYALLSLISTIDDTNIYHRGGDSGAKFAKSYAKKLLENKLDKSLLVKMDEEFIMHRLSPGGSADLLAITYFLHSLRELKFI